MPKHIELGKWFFTLTLSLVGFSAYARSDLNCDRKIDDFSKETIGKFPSQWSSTDEKALKKIVESGTYYTVQKDASKTYLKALTSGGAFTIFKEMDKEPFLWNLDEYPYLRWKWRAKQLPKDANEKYMGSNDAGASVYVIWKANFVMKVKSIKFTWSSSLDIGTHVSKRFGLDQVQVLQNQKSKLNSWVEQTVDVRSLYKSYFEDGKDKVAQPIAIAILSDADATKSTAEADYADFYLCREGASATGSSKK